MIVELQDRYEKDTGELQAEIRLLKNQMRKMQEESEINRRLKQETSEEMKLEELEDDYLHSRNNTPFFEALRPSSEKHSSGKHFTKLSSIHEWEGLDDEEIERRLRMLYAQFFSNDFKTSQDKIRNKNQVFKQLFAICLQDMQHLRDLLRKCMKESESVQLILNDHETLR